MMDFYLKYVKRNNKGEMVVRGLPPEMKQLFKDAGVKPKELKDPETAKWLIEIMNDALAKMPVITEDAPPPPDAGAYEEVLRVEAMYDFHAQQEGDLSFSKGDIVILHQKYDNGWADGEFNGAKGQFPFNYVKELPPEPRKAPPPAPAPRSFPEPTVAAAEPVAAVPEAPAAAAPAPPPMPVAAPAPPPPPPSGPKPPAAPKPPSAASKPVASDASSGSGGRGFSANDLASGASRLRKVENTDPPAGGKKDLKNLTAAERTNMLDIISSAMNARRKDIVEDDDDDDDDGWSDEEDDW